MELHQRHFEKAGSRSEEFASGLVPLCSNNSSTQFLPLNEITTQQFTLVDCPINPPRKILNGDPNRSSDLRDITSTSGVNIQSSELRTGVESFNYVKPTKVIFFSVFLPKPSLYHFYSFALILRVIIKFW